MENTTRLQSSRRMAKRTLKKRFVYLKKRPTVRRIEDGDDDYNPFSEVHCIGTCVLF